MSLKGDKYESAEEVEARVGQSVVLYDKQPVYITRVTLPEGENEVARVFFTPLPLAKGHLPETRKFLSSKNFDLAPFKMGYFDWNNEAILVSRAPVRQYKQGLSENTASFRTTNGARPDFTLKQACAMQPFADMIAGKYEPFRKVVERFQNPKVRSAALSQSFALEADGDLELYFLLHRGTRVAAYLLGNDSIKLPAKFRFLKEEAAECGIPVT